MGILELHFHDSEFMFAPAIGSKRTSSDDSEGIESLPDETTDDTGGTRPVLALVVGLAFALLLGLLAKRAGGGDDEIDLPEDPVEAE